MPIHPTYRAKILSIMGSIKDNDIAIFGGAGAPSGGVVPGRGQALHASESAIYLREDGAAGSTIYVTVNGGTAWTALTNATFDPQDGEFLTFGNADDITIQWDGTDLLVAQATANSAIKWGVSGAGIDHVFYGDTAGRNMTWDQSADGLLFADSASLLIGTGSDIAISWDGTRLNVTQAAVNSEIRWGVDGAGIDQMWYGDTASTYATWDQSRDTFRLSDAAILGFGTGAGAAADIEITWSGTALNVTQLTANSAINMGVDGAGIDLVLYGDTASQKATWDQSADALVLTAAVSITGQGSTVVPLIPIAAPQALSGAGAVNITTYRTNWTTTGANAGTLANGAQIGQLKRIQQIVDGGDGTLTPTSLSGGTTITFADAGDYAVLCWNGTAWVAIELGNEADGATAPVLA